MPSRRIFFAFFLTCGVLSLALGLWLFADRQSFLREAEKTVGHVVKLEKSGWTSSRYGPSKPLFRAVVRYRTATGTEVEFRDTTSSRPALYVVGQTVDVWYRPRD